MNESAKRKAMGDGDLALIQRLRVGEEDAATALYLRYADRILNLANYQTSKALSYKVGAEDIVQTVFRTFFRRASNGEYQAVEGDALWKLLLVIALNKIRKKADYYHAQKRDVRRDISLDFRPGEVQAKQASDEIAVSILHMTISDLASYLPVKYRRIIQLRIDGHEVQQIAEQAGCAKRTVERVLQEFRQRLQQSLESDGAIQVTHCKGEAS